MTFGERAADALARFAGSWKFIIGQTCFITLWIFLNTVAWFYHFDPMPWILLNLCMSTQAMYTGPIVMLSQNRQSQKDREQVDRIEKLALKIESVVEKVATVEGMLDQHIQEQRAKLELLERLICEN